MKIGLQENFKKRQELVEASEDTPWIITRNKLITVLTDKRRELGISQTTMAKALNTSQSAINRFEGIVTNKGTNPSNPTIKFIASYVDALGMDVDFQLKDKQEH